MNRQKHKLSRRILAVLLMAAMLITMLPSGVFAAPSDAETPATANSTVSTSQTTDGEQNGITLSKTVTGDQKNGYQLELEAYASAQKEDITTSKPLDIVLVLDTSGSMSNELSDTYSVVEDKTSWSYNDIANSYTEYYYWKDGSYHLVRGDFDWRDRDDYNLQYQTGIWWQSFTQETDDPDEAIYNGNLYTRTNGEKN